ncbi:MAG: hypothetical protein K6F00_07590 [Lachnospiraceae bacterium]|nr:hypothetical protein [Lachnospiraceae bacterium]
MENESKNKINFSYIADFNRQKLFILMAICITCMCNLFASFVSADIVYNTTSPIATMLIVAIMADGITESGNGWTSGFYFLFGIFFWALSDLLVIIYTYFEVGSNFLEAISDTLYLMPNYTFMLAFFLLIFFRCDKRQKKLLVIGEILVTLILGVGYAQYVNIDFGVSGYTSEYGVSAVAYAIPVIYSFSTILILFIIRDIRKEGRAFYMVLAGIFIYNILELRYTYYTAAHLEPELPVLDVVYLATMILIALAYNDPTMNHKEKNEKV